MFASMYLLVNTQYLVLFRHNVIHKAAFTNCTVTIELIYPSTDSFRTAGLHNMFGKACCLKTTVRFPLNRDSTAPPPFISHSFAFCLFQASNGNDPWSVWNADPSGGSNNNWASNPEGTQTGRTAPDPWASVSQGHPQAYQGPGKIFIFLFSQQALLESFNRGLHH